MIDLAVSITVAATPEDVARIMFTPARYPDWMHSVHRVEAAPGPAITGDRVTNHGAMMGQPLSWTMVVVVSGPQVLELNVVDGPFVGTVTYTVLPRDGGAHVQIHDVGRLEGPAAGLPVGQVEAALRQSIAADLGRLKALVESEAAAARVG
ncbi:MAG: hypothetical protein FJW21_13640 [Acidimicrobiia bacterium]|nr:hypothetical protein [Acidimicrobiia bacterium]